MRRTLLAAALCSGFLFGCSDLSSVHSTSGGSPAPAPSPSPKPSTPPPGYSATATPGIYMRWCTKTCDSSQVPDDTSYWLVEIWCKERACGDIYGRVNLLNSSDVVVGWTNATGYGDVGQKVLLTFSTYDEAEKAQITELNFSA